MQNLAKQNERIRIGKAEIETTAGEKTKHISLNELEEDKYKGGLGGNGKKPGNTGNTAD